MLNLLKSTQVNKFVPKEKLIDKLNLSPVLKESIKDHVKRFTIANELSPKSMNIAKGEAVSGIFVMEVLLKQKSIDYKLIEAVARKNKHKLLFALSCKDEIQLAVFYGKLYCSDWVKQNDIQLEIKGDNFDAVWENIVAQIALVKTEVAIEQRDTSIATRLAKQEGRIKLKKEIDQLEKQARKETQPKRKFEIVGKVSELKKKLEETKS